MVVFLEGSPISTEELQSDHWVLDNLPDQGLSPPIAQSQIMSIQLNLPQVDSNQVVETSQG